MPNEFVCILLLIILIITTIYGLNPTIDIIEENNRVTVYIWYNKYEDGDMIRKCVKLFKI